MLRKVHPDKVEIGMYVHGFEGSWFDHPFLRSRFLLASPRDVQRVRDSGVDAVVIDDARGAREPRSVEPAIAARSPARDRDPIGRRLARLRETVEPRRRDLGYRDRLKPCSAAEEFGRASRLVAKSKRAMQRAFADVRLGKAVRADRLAPLVDDITASITRNPSALISIARLKRRHEYTYMHSVAVCALMINLGRELGLDEASVRDAGVAGLLHDVGKMLVPEALLDKQGALSDQEFDAVRGHARLGHRLLLASAGIPEAATDVCLHHHERVDGAGYPDGLAGDAISLVARMGAICDVYDAVTSDRSYKDAWQPATALARMLEWTGHFDPQVLAAFIRSIGIHPIGTLVRLESDRLAIVAADNPADPMRPALAVFFSTRTRREVTPHRWTPASGEILGAQRPAAWGLEDWEAVRARVLAAV